MTTSNEFGRADEQGNVYLNTLDGEVKVGQFTAGEPAQGLEFFTKRFNDLKIEAELALKRLSEGKGSFDAINTLIDRLKTTVSNPNVIGRISDLEELASKINDALEKQKVIAAERKTQLRESAMKRREELAELAVKLADSKSWKSTSEQFKNMLDEWKKLATFDRAKEQELWKKFSQARSTFDKARRAHFANLDKVRNEVNETKTALIKKANELSESKEWATTTAAYKKLLDEWKKLPRAAKSEEEKLWNSFKAAQDKFFSARNEENSKRDESLKGNLSVKEELVKLAEGLLPIKDVDAAKTALRDIQEKWEKAGHVPRSDRDKIEKRLKSVENEVRKHVEEIWRKSKPEVIERANSLVTSFEKSLEKIEKQINEALSKGDNNSADDLKKQKIETQALLDAAKVSANNLN